jgi:hypothetical protein
VSLELNEQQLEILKKVRSAMTRRQAGISHDASEFICVNILREVGLKHGVLETQGIPFCEFPQEMQDEFTVFRQAIDLAIDGRATLGILIGNLGLNIRIGDIMTTVAPLARLAWIDRMIDTRQIA